jgi:hypothetical protein
MGPNHNVIDLVRHFFCDFVFSFDFYHMPHYAIFERGQLCMVRVLDPPLLDPMIRQQNRAQAEVERDHKQKRLLENVARVRKRKE